MPARGKGKGKGKAAGPGSSGRGRRSRGKGGARSAIATFFVWTFRLLLLSLGVGLCYEAIRFPNVSMLTRERPGKTSFMKYREEQARNEGRPYHIEQHWVPLARMGSDLREAVLASEDDRFYSHQGFDGDEMKEALEDHFVEGKKLRGASTISQQLAKNLWLGPERTMLRKGREALYTWVLERRLSKDRILELYLNVVEWGPGIFGADAAAKHWFGVPPEKLTREQAALLAAALPNPLKRDPANPSRYLARRAKNLQRWMGPESGRAESEPEAGTATGAAVSPRPEQTARAARPPDVPERSPSPREPTPPPIVAVAATPRATASQAPVVALRPTPSPAGRTAIEATLTSPTVAPTPDVRPPRSPIVAVAASSASSAPAVATKAATPSATPSGTPVDLLR